jgi:hypothetical protein
MAYEVEMLSLSRISPYNERHERHHRHTGAKIPYISHFTNDDEHDDGLTLTDTPTLGPSCENPLGIGK